MVSKLNSRPFRNSSTSTGCRGFTPIPVRAPRSDSGVSTRYVAFAPMPAGGFRTSGKPVSFAKLSASPTEWTSRFFATGSPAAASSPS